MTDLMHAAENIECDRCMGIYTQGYAKTRIYRQNYIVLRKRWSLFDKGYVA